MRVRGAGGPLSVLRPPRTRPVGLVQRSAGGSPMVFVFGECALDVDRRELRRAGIVRPLEPKAFLVLVHLLTQRHRAVSKDELLATCWPNEFVTEAALTRCLRVIRQAVADDGVRQHL